LPEEFSPKWEAEKLQQIMRKTKNLDRKLPTTLVVAFAATVNSDNNSTSLNKLLHCVQMDCKQYPYNSREGLSTHKNVPLELSKTQTHPTDKSLLKWIQEYHYSPVAGYPG
jgi:hypothetical protein